MLSAGLPSVVIPVFADQPNDAACYAALGAVVIESGDQRVEAIRAAMRALADNPSCRHVRDEMAALPGPEYAVELREQLAVASRPLLME